VKVLQLSTYPIKVPRHGGQIRVYQIGQKLRELGHEVEHLSFSELSHKYFNKESDFIMQDSLLNREISTLYSTDLATSIVCEKNKKCLNFLMKKIKEFRPDFIFLEQPWLWPALKKIQNKQPELINNIVYSSQNVEFLTKETLFKSNAVEDKDDVVQKIKSIELDLIENSHYIVSCTESDAALYKELSGKNSIVCHNGVSNIIKNDEVYKLRQSLRSKLGNKQYALFVGSSYPPNAQGFWDNLGSSMGWLNMDEFIFSAGGCSNILESFMPKDNSICSYLNFDKIKRLGLVSENELSALIQESSMIILPISDGGGSNLKTAEAIISCKPVVASEKACRGFSDVEQYSNFYICNGSDEFKNKMKTLFSEGNQVELSLDEIRLREKVCWNECLKNLSEVVI
jgi:glycosyltransferase involved in cell wall biosynthesis